MNHDFIKELGYKALDSRLKRISDRMSHDIRKLYKELDLDIEQNSYLCFYKKRKVFNILYRRTFRIRTSFCCCHC